MSSRRTQEEGGDADVAELDPDHPQPASSETVRSGSPGRHTTSLQLGFWCHVAGHLWKRD